MFAVRARWGACPCCGAYSRLDAIVSTRVLTLGDNRDRTSMARQRVRIVVFVHTHVIAFAMVLSVYIITGQAREGASNSGWHVVIEDEVTEHHFCHSANSGASVFCACSKMHAGIPRACSVAQVVLAQCKLGCDQRGNFGKERKLHFVKNKTEKSAKIPAISLHFKFVNIRKDYVLRP